MSLYREFCHATPGYVKRRDAQTGCDLNSEESPFGINNAELLQRLNNENSELLAKNEELSAEIGLLSADIEEMKLRLDIKSTIDSGAAAALEEESSSRKQKTFIVSHTSPITKPVAAEIERHRSVPVGFAKYIRSKQSTAASKDDERLLTEISSMASNADELVSLLSRCLPQIVPNVLINKREELIPLLICAMVLHSNTAVRDQLLSTLYNLVKKPDERQRQMILAGCDAFARYAGPMRAEAELLPQCWEQINHKHVERRLLVAETCGVLAPSLPPALLSSLVLSMLQQMIVEDKSEDVRMAAVLSLASVCLYIEDRDKFSQVSNVVQRALTDSSQKVIQSAQSVLLPSFAVWAESIGKLQLGVAALFVRKLLQLLQTSGINQAANEAIMCNYISSLKAVTPVLYWSVIRSGTYDQTEAIEGGQRNIASDNPVGQLIFEGDSALERQRALFEKHTAQEWFTSWDSLDFVTRDMLPQLVSILGMLEVNLPKTVSYLIDYFQDFCRTFGHGFCVSKLRPLFTPSLNIAKNFAELSKEEQSKCGVGRATLPVYCAGVLSAVESPEDWQELRRFLRWKMSSIAEAGAPTAAVAVTFSQLCRRWSDHESLLQIVWESLPHKNVRMRAICAEVLSRLALETSGQLIKSKVVPGLVTLAADSEPSIRISTVSGFANVIQVAAQDEEMMDKVKMQLSSMFEDTDASVVSHLVHLIAQSAPTMDSNFRDEFVLPHLSQLVERNASSASKRESSSVSRAAVSAALFDAYSAISCCFLSPAATADYFIPGLRALMNGLDPQHVKIAASILRDAENKLAAAEHSDLSKRGSMMMGDTSVEDMRNKMVNTFRDIKGKVDFPKDAVPNIFRKKPN
uniref:HEAT repeat protein n=1 Tax=Plectus sambesii TaxID=2011161 RepID=A0A914X366_9BILA